MQTMTHDNIPYGVIKFTVANVSEVTATEDSAPYEKSRAKKGWVEVSGIVVKGGEQSRLLEHTSFKDKKGQNYKIQMPREAFESGYYQTMAN